MSRPVRPSKIEAAKFFHLRSPLLPFDEVEAWSAGLQSADGGPDPERLTETLARDREVLRQRLKAVFTRPEVREALLTASPGIASGLAAWEQDPESKRGRAAEDSLVRYFLRMATRCTPFGLLSGVSMGWVEARTELCLAPRERYRRHSRLDSSYLCALARDLENDPQVRPSLIYRPNDSLYEAAGRLHFAEATPRDAMRMSHHLVAVDKTAPLENTLARAEAGATLSALARALAGEMGGEVSIEEAEEFVGELASAQILVSDLTPAVTGPEPAEPLIERLRGCPGGEPVARVLAEVCDELARLDAGGLGADPEAYSALADRLGELPTAVERSQLFQIDLVKPAAASLGTDVLAEITRGVELLWRWSAALESEELADFRRRLSERYGERQAVPLVEALDREIGVGFGRQEWTGSDGSPLLEGLPLMAQAAEPPVWRRRHESLLRAAGEALAAGATAIELPQLPEDLAEDPPPLPDSFYAMAMLATRSPEDLARGGFRLLLRGAAGPSAARLLGRFCRADEVLRRAVEAHLRAEEALQPGALFAEVVHLAADRTGNILLRPLLRQHEIPYLGRSGAPLEQQIPVTDLQVAVQGREIVLTSARHGCRVVPRLTSAHFPTEINPPLYRFLWWLQHQGAQGRVFWSWGPLAGLPFLPRVTSGRLVLARARWRMSAAEISSLLATSGAGRVAAVARWREQRRLPREVLMIDGDKQLLVRFDNPLNFDAFLSMVRKYSVVDLEELFPGPEELCATGPEGRFLHELVVPFLCRREERQEAAAPQRAAAIRSGRRSFPPGSEWLYAKVYTGTATADRLLVEEIAPLAERALAAGAADRWYFLRYGDPSWHLRLRFHGEPEALQREVAVPLATRSQEWIAQRRAWRLQLDTYEREIERYGGLAGAEIAERLWHVDSEAVLALLSLLEGAEAGARWKLALCGIDALIGDAGLAGWERLGVLEQMRDGYLLELGAGADLKPQLSGRLRRWRPELEALLDPAAGIEGVLGAGREVLAARSQYLSPIFAELREKMAAGLVGATLPALAGSFAHLFANRLLRTGARPHEAVIYDFLLQLHRSRQERMRGRGQEEP